MTRAWTVVWVGWACFIVSLGLPAIKVDMGAWNNPDARYAFGFECALVMPYFYPSNVLMLLAPLLAKLCARPRLHGWPRRTLAIALLASSLGALACLPMFHALHAGYVLWVLSFPFAATALWMTRTHERDPKDHERDA